MPQPPHTHRNPPITPHPKTVFLSDLSVCITDSSKGTPVALHNASMSFLPSQKSLRFLTHHHRHRQTPHHHTHHHKHPRLHTHIHMSQTHVRLPHFLIHRRISQSSHMFTITHTLTTSSTFYTNRCHHKQRPRQLHIHSRQHWLLPHQFILPPIRTHTRLQHLHAKLKPSLSTTSLQNIHARKLKSSCDDNFQGFVMRGGLALVLETPKEINTILKQTKWDGDFFGKDLYIHLANKDARPWLCVKKVPPTMELAKIKEGISSIDPVMRMENWEIRIEGLHRKFKGSYPTQLVLFKVQNDLVAKNISDQNFTIDGKQFKIREYLKSTSFRCTRRQELGSHQSKDCSNPKKCVRCAGPDCEIRNCKKDTLLCSNCGGGHSAAHKSYPALKTKKQNLFHQKQQKSHAEHQLDEIIPLKEQISEVAHLKSEFLALKTELAEVKEQNKRYEKKLSELITYSIFHNKNTKAQEEICFIVRREAEKVFRYPSEHTTDAHPPIPPTPATHTPTPSPTMVTSSQSSPHSHQSSHNHSQHTTPPPPQHHRHSSPQPPTRTSLRLRERNRTHSQS